MRYLFVLLIGLGLIIAACSKSTAQAQGAIYPASDPNNTEDWVLNEALSDEFEGTELDKVLPIIIQVANYYLGYIGLLKTKNLSTC